MSQAELAEGVQVTSSFISLLESGKRVPREPLLELLAKRLWCSVEYLTTGRDGPDERDMRVELQFAELALRSGDPREARDQFQRILERAERLGFDDVLLEARWGCARADEALGDFIGAIAGFLALAAEDDLPPGISRTAVITGCSRSFSEAGQLDRAIEVGETALAQARRLDPASTSIDEILELASTLVGHYYRRGDMTQAFALARHVIEEAERHGTLRGRAAAYWNAALVAEARGEMKAAAHYGQRAAALYSELQDGGAGRPRRRSTVTVPRVLGLTLDDARFALIRCGLAAVGPDPDGPSLSLPLTGWPRGVVTDQSPAAGAEVPQGSSVTLWLERGDGTAGVREPRRPAPDPKGLRAMRDEPSDEPLDEAVG